MAKGGKRPGAGRKPIAIEDNVKGAIKNAIGDDPEVMTNIWRKVFLEAKKGSVRHTEILFNYYYGKPKDNEGQPTEMIIRVQRRG